MVPVGDVECHQLLTEAGLKKPSSEIPSVSDSTWSCLKCCRNSGLHFGMDEALCGQQYY